MQNGDGGIEMSQEACIKCGEVCEWRNCACVRAKHKALAKLVPGLVEALEFAKEKIARLAPAGGAFEPGFYKIIQDALAEARRVMEE